MIRTEKAKKLYFNCENREEKRYVRVPKNIEDAKKLGAVLSHYKEQYYHQVLIAYFTSYVLYPLVTMVFKNFLMNNFIQIHTRTTT